MGLAENKAVIRRYYEEAHGGNSDVVEELVADGCLVHGWGRERRVSLDEARKAVQGFRVPFPDWKVTVDQLIAEGDLVASELTITGTQSGQFRRFAPTGKEVKFSGFFIDRVVDGKIVEMWHKPDFLTMLIQIGAVPEDVMAG